MIIRKEDLFLFFNRCISEKIDNYEEVLLPKKNNKQDEKQFSFTKYNSDENIEYDLESFRTIDPIKTLFYLSRENVSSTSLHSKKRIVAGIKACDLKALNILDKALINDDFVDPAYKKLRDNTLVISSDCNRITDSCHCNLVGGKPYSESNYDINLSKVNNNDYYYIVAGSKKGEKFLNTMKEHVAVNKAPQNVFSLVEENRKDILEKLEKQNKEYYHTENFYELKNSEEKLWIENSDACVGCGACTNICPTCYCFILNDETEAEKFVKVRSYDSCQYHGYARVAGDGSPRPKMHQRFRNRYLCKFSYFNSNFDTIGCVGCGRCIDACPAEIDFREVVKKSN